MQSWNWPAIKKCARLIFDPKLMIPKLSYKNVSDIDWARLKNEHGIRAVCFDKDNTITAPYSKFIDDSIFNSIEKCKQVFADQVVVFSNSIGSSQFDPDFEKAKLFTLETGLEVIKHNSKKPNGAEYILNRFGHLENNQIALIGDRILTDVIMGNEAGFMSVLVSEPLSIEGDNIASILIRLFEQKVLEFLLKNK